LPKAHLSASRPTVREQIGHVNPKFTFSVSLHVATRRYIDEQAVWGAHAFADESAERLPSANGSRPYCDKKTRNGSVGGSVCV
jgi:hypothetical protein